MGTTLKVERSNLKQSWQEIFHLYLQKGNSKIQPLSTWRIVECKAWLSFLILHKPEFLKVTIYRCMCTWSITLCLTVFRQEYLKIFNNIWSLLCLLVSQSCQCSFHTATTQNSEVELYESQDPCKLNDKRLTKNKGSILLMKHVIHKLLANTHNSKYMFPNYTCHEES